jgi:hypothetical protein
MGNVGQESYPLPHAGKERLPPAFGLAFGARRSKIWVLPRVGAGLNEDREEGEEGLGVGASADKAIPISGARPNLLSA